MAVNIPGVGHRFTRGDRRPAGSGRKPGQLNYSTLETRDLCERMISDATYQTNLFTRLKNGKLHPSIETLLWHYARGKPVEEIRLTGLIGIADPSKMSPAELDAELLASRTLIEEALANREPRRIGQGTTTEPTEDGEDGGGK